MAERNISQELKMKWTNGPLGIAPTFLKLDSWSLGAGSYSYYIHNLDRLDVKKGALGGPSLRTDRSEK